ncbi:hypothetical protein TIFTF001_003196 [Ficus carica]|uniref:Uncharacterized protein n=1 Tax=Ficus carica TaxID=3494 RepID=A0AA88CUZ4_FICCA|nr:hypothetical protein TIFTF001_003196 [Ficus carica]
MLGFGTGVEDGFQDGRSRLGFKTEVGVKIRFWNKGLGSRMGFQMGGQGFGVGFLDESRGRISGQRSRLGFEIRVKVGFQGDTNPETRPQPLLLFQNPTPTPTYVPKTDIKTRP